MDELQRDLLIDFGGQLDVGVAALCACLHRHAGDFRIELLDADPDAALIDAAMDSAGDVSDSVGLAVKRAFGQQHAVFGDDLFGSRENLVGRTLVTRLDFIIDEGDARGLSAIDGIDAAGCKQRKTRERSKKFRFHYGHAITFSKSVKHGFRIQFVRLQLRILS